MSRPVRLLILSIAICWHVLALATVWPKAVNSPHARDFASYYYAADVAAKGGDPYDRALLERTSTADGTRRQVYPYLYPPPFLLVVSWAPLLSLKTAYWAWFWCNEVALALAVAAMARWWRRLPGDPTVVILVVVALVTAVPSNHLMGQANLLVLALAIAGLWQADEKRPILGGILLGLAVVLKGSPILLVLWWMLRGRWKAVGAAAVSGFIALAASTAIYGWQPVYSFVFRVLPSMRSGFYNNLGLPVHLFTNHSLPDLLHQVFLDKGPLLSTTTQVLSTVAAVAILGGLAWLWRKSPPDDLARYAQPAALMVVALLLPTFTYEHHVVFAIPAVVLAIIGISQGRYPMIWTVMLGVCIAAWAFDMKALLVLSESYEATVLGGLVREFKSLALFVIAGAMVRLQWRP